MARIRHAVNVRKPIYQGAPSKAQTLPEGKVRCPSCGSAVSLTPNGRLRSHNDRDGAPCPHRWHGREVDLTDLPSIVIDDPAPRLPNQQPGTTVTKAKKKPPSKTGLHATGHCHGDDCDRRISGERLFCGPCLAKRGR